MKIIYTLLNDVGKARKIADDLVSSKIVACVNIIKNVESVYRWNGNVISGDEIILLIKTTAELSEEVVKRLTVLHTYDIPCIVQVNDCDVNSVYKDWLYAACARIS